MYYSFLRSNTLTPMASPMECHFDKIICHFRLFNRFDRSIKIDYFIVYSKMCVTAFFEYDNLMDYFKV